MLKLIHIYDMSHENVLEYLKSFTTKKDINSYAIELAAEGKERYVNYVLQHEPHMYYLVDDTNEGYILGYGSIEDSIILDYHLSYLNVGNIGYGIRQSERNKHYGTELLTLLLKECENLGMYEVCISCLKTNIASKKIIEAHNGKLEKEFFDDDLGNGLKYWIKLKPRIDNRIKRYIKREKEKSKRKY